MKNRTYQGSALAEQKPAEQKPHVITVYQSIGGWKAVEYWWNPELGGFWEPWQTGVGAYRTEAEAVDEAKTWAEAEGLRYLAKGEAP